MRHTRRSVSRTASLLLMLVFSAVTLLGLSAGNAHAIKLVSTVKVIDKMPTPPDGYAVPDDPNVLFFLYRSKNPNTVVYAARLDADGKLSSKEPVEAFWRRYNTNGQRKALKATERRLAYGVVTQPSDGGNGEYLAHIVSYPKRKALVRLDDKGKPIATMKLGKHTVQLAYAYVDVDTSGLFPVVYSVDLYGHDLATGDVVWERLTPKDKRRKPAADK